MGAISKRASDLERCERTIDSSVDATGQALQEIRDGRLYLETHDTFDKYCRERWGFSKSQANNLISASQTRQGLTTIVVTDRIPKRPTHLLEVAKAPEKKRAEVVEKAHEIAEEKGREPTARDFKAARELVVEPEESPVLAQAPDPFADDGDEYEDAEEPTLEDQVLAGREKIVGTVNNVNALKRELNAYEEAPGLEVVISRRRQLLTDLDVIKGTLLAGMPAGLCPRCDGEPDGCECCGNRGWVNAATLKGARGE